MQVNTVPAAATATAIRAEADAEAADSKANANSSNSDGSDGGGDRGDGGSNLSERNYLSINLDAELVMLEDCVVSGGNHATTLFDRSVPAEADASATTAARDERSPQVTQTVDGWATLSTSAMRPRTAATAPDGGHEASPLTALAAPPLPAITADQTIDASSGASRGETLDVSPPQHRKKSMENPFVEGHTELGMPALLDNRSAQVPILATLGQDPQEGSSPVACGTARDAEGGGGVGATVAVFDGAAAEVRGALELDVRDCYFEPIGTSSHTHTRARKGTFPASVHLQM